MAHRLNRQQLGDLLINPVLIQAINFVEWNADDRELVIDIVAYSGFDITDAANTAMAVSNTIKQIQVTVEQKKFNDCYVKVGRFWRRFHMKDLATYFGGRKNLRHP